MQGEMRVSEPGGAQGPWLLPAALVVTLQLRYNARVSGAHLPLHWSHVEIPPMQSVVWMLASFLFASPAFADSSILIRTATRLFKISEEPR